MSIETWLRVKIAGDKKWVESDSISKVYHNTILLAPKGVIWEKIIPETFGLYTGMPDKNGKKIYDGDIVRHTKKGSSPRIVTYSARNGTWILSGPRNGRMDMFLCVEAYRLEVIGNIFDNPELLEGEENE